MKKESETGSVTSMGATVGTKSASLYEDYMLGVDLFDMVPFYPGMKHEGVCSPEELAEGCFYGLPYGEFQTEYGCLCFLYDPDLTPTKFINPIDLNPYSIDFAERNFIPQGLTIDENGVLIISMYHEPQIRNSIIVWYDPAIDKVIRVRDVEEGFTGHVGGVAYYKEPTKGKSFLLVSNDGFINIYRYQGTGNDFYLQFHRSVRIFDDYYEYKNSYMSVSEGGYLWTGYYGTKTTPMTNAPFKGFKLIYDTFYDENDVFWYSLNIGNKGIEVAINGDPVQVANFELKYPKTGGQGVYCDGNPETSKRLNCYFVSSYTRDEDGIDWYGSETSVYKVTLNFKDQNGDGIISEQNSEWVWEHMYKPYYSFETDGASPTGIPVGGEGIVKDPDGYLWMVNEGATKKYCEKWGAWDGSDNLDCTHQLLRINPITLDSAENGEVDLMQNGMIQLEGTGINNGLGEKVGLILAQNKKGELYYSPGRFMYSGRKLLLHFINPSSENPRGFQAAGYGYQYSNGSQHDYYRARVKIEDIKGLIIFNIDENRGDSDDWKLETVKITMDESYFVEQYNSSNIYNKRFDLTHPAIFGDDNLNQPYSGDSQYVRIFLESFYEGSHENREITLDGNKSTQYTVTWRDIEGILSDIREQLNDCYMQGYSINNCIQYLYPDRDFRCALYQDYYINWTYLYRMNSVTNSYEYYDECDR